MGLEEVGAKLVLEGQSQFISGMKQAENASSGFGKVLSKVAEGIAQGFGQSLFNAVSRGIGAIPDLMQSAMKATMEWGQGLDDIGDVLGTTTKEGAGLASMFKTIGGDSKQLTSAMALMTKGLTNVDGTLGPTGKSLAALGINFRDAKGKMLPATKIFQLVADKLGPMPEGLEKTSAMMDIFGKSGKEMGDALNAAANGGMDAYIQQAEAMGLAIDPEQVIENKKSFETLKLVFTGLAVQLGTSLLPAIQWVTKEITKLASNPAIKEWIKSFTGYITQAVTWVQTQWPIISETFINVFSIIQSTIDDVKRIIQSFLSTIQGWWADNGDKITSTTSTMWNGVKGLFSAAAKFIQTLISKALEVIQAFWQAHGENIMRIVNWLWTTIQTIFNTAISIVTSIFTAFTALLEGDWDGFTKNMLAAWDTLWVLIRSAAEGAWAILSEWFTTVIHQLLAFFLNTDWGRIGSEIINGIWNGIKGGWDWLVGKVRELASSMLAAALSALQGSGNVGNVGNGGIIPQSGGNYTGVGAKPKRGGEQFASGGQFTIPMGFGYEGFNLGGMATASGGETVTITPKNVSAGPSTYNYNYSTNYNLNLSTQESQQSVRQSFAMMKMLAG